MHELGFIHAPAFRALKGTMTKGKRGLNNGTNIKDCKNQFEVFSSTTPYHRNTLERVYVSNTHSHPSSFTGATFFQRDLQWHVTAYIFNSVLAIAKRCQKNQSCTQWGTHEILAASIGRKKKILQKTTELWGYRDHLAENGKCRTICREGKEKVGRSQQNYWDISAETCQD